MTNVDASRGGTSAWPSPAAPHSQRVLLVKNAASAAAIGRSAHATFAHIAPFLSTAQDENGLRPTPYFDTIEYRFITLAVERRVEFSANEEARESSGFLDRSSPSRLDFSWNFLAHVSVRFLDGNAVLMPLREKAP